jgi:diguanylate cyclase (GGDEF)-like protein/PAS domain S-box-containing protein
MPRRLGTHKLEEIASVDPEVVRLKEEIFRLETLIDTVPDSIYFKDRQSRFTRINRYAAQRYGLPDPSLALGRSDFDYFTEEHAAKAYGDEQQIVATGRALVNVEEKETGRDGSIRWVSTTKMPLRDTEGLIVGTFGISRDITQRKHAEDQLERQAYYDPLTELPNRALFRNRLQHLFHRARDRARRSSAVGLFGLLYLDLDRFKAVNDGLGHQAGDELLIGIARRLEKCLRPGDTLARIGGDEFTVLLEDISSEEDATRVAERIHQELSEPMAVDGQEVFTTVSLGIALSSSGYGRPEDMLRDADIAMYRAKANGRARHQVFDGEMHKRAASILRLETDLRRALDRRQLIPYYQPIVDLETRALVGFEALARWNHPTRGLVLPDEFIPIAEETGLVGAIGEWMLTEACRQMKTWQERYPRTPPLSISVNASTRQLAHASLVDQVRRILTETRLPPTSLTLEITESALMENREIGASVIRGLRELGVRFNIDDFGTGYSSLAYLHEFPIDTLKVDKSFVRRMGEAPEHAKIVKAIISLAENLGMMVIAEGVETNAQADALRELHCMGAQGYLFSPPVAAAEAEALIVNGIADY